jgi:hypothetical protein
LGVPEEFILKEKEIKDLAKLKKDLTALTVALDRVSEMEPFMNLLANFLWRQEAKTIMNKAIAMKDEKLSEFLGSAPKEIKMASSKEFEDICEKLKGKGQLCVDERAVYEKLVEFLEADKLPMAKVSRFVDANRAEHGKNPKIEKYLDLLFNVSKIFNNQEFMKVDWLSEELKDLRFGETKTYWKLQDITRGIENAKREKFNLQANRIRVSSLQATKYDLLKIQDMPKLKESKAQECIKTFGDLPDLINLDFQEEISLTRSELLELDKLNKTIEAMKKKLLENINKDKLKSVDSSVTEYTALLATYQSVNYSSDKTESLIEILYTAIKAKCLLDEIQFGVDGKSISVWESIAQKLSQENVLKGQMMSKTVQVRAFINKVENIKSWTKGTNKYDLATFQKQLKEVQKFSGLIDFNND